jgi:hypothetical protein
MPRRVNMRHDVNGPASRKRFIRTAAGIRRQRIDAGKDAGVRTKQRDRPEQPLGFLDHVKDVFFLRNIAFECRTIKRGRDVARTRDVEIGHDHLGGAGAVKGFAQRPPDAVGATGNDDDFAAHLHRKA